MIDFCFSSELWDVGRPENWYTKQDLWTRMMGLSIWPDASNLWEESKTPLIMSMLGYFERWCNAFLRYHHCARKCAAFLAQPAAAPIRVRSLVWLESGANAGGDYWWKEHDMADTLARLLTVIWTSQQSELKQHQPAFAVFVSFVSKLASHLNPIALELESRI